MNTYLVIAFLLSIALTFSLVWTIHIKRLLALNYTKYNEEEEFEVATGVPLSYVKQGQQIASVFVLVSVGITVVLSIQLANDKIANSI